MKASSDTQTTAAVIVALIARRGPQRKGALGHSVAVSRREIERAVRFLLDEKIVRIDGKTQEVTLTDRGRGLLDEDARSSGT